MTTPPAMPRLPAILLRALLPLADRDEVLAELAEEHADRARRSAPWPHGSGSGGRS